MKTCCINHFQGLAHFERMKLQTAETEEKYISSQAHVEDLKKTVADLQDQLNSSSAAAEVKSENNFEMSETVVNLESEIETLKADLHLAHQKIEEMSSGQIDQMNQSLVDLESSINQKKEVLDNYDNQLAAKTNEKVAELTKKLKAYSKARKDLISEKEELQKQKDMIGEQMVQVMKESEDLKANLQGMSQSSAHLEEVMKEAEVLKVDKEAAMKKLEELQVKTVEQAKTIDLMSEDISNFMTEKKTFARSNEESSARNEEKSSRLSS